MNYKVQDMSELYALLGSDLLHSGQDVLVGRMHKTTTKELRSVNIELKNPHNNLLLSTERKFNLAFAIAESLMLFDTDDDSDAVKYYSHFNKNIANFSDDGEIFEGSYSKRVANYIPEIISMLREDHTTRQAVIQIYGSEYIFKDTKDVPCTLDIQFLIRDNKLELHVYMRSNDVIWGLPYDIFNFTNLQIVVANTLGLEVGSYFHTVTSMHVYDYHYELLERIVEELANPVWDSIYKSLNLEKNEFDYTSYMALKDFYKKAIVDDDFLNHGLPSSCACTTFGKVLKAQNFYKINKNDNRSPNILVSHIKNTFKDNKIRLFLYISWGFGGWLK